MRVAGVLDGGGVGEIFALAADGGADEVAAENADESQHGESAADRRESERAAPAVSSGEAEKQGVAQNGMADVAQRGDAENDAHQPHIKPHVAVQNVAEFVRDDALQFVARQGGKRAFGDADDGVGFVESGGEGVDGLRVGRKINGRRLRAGGERHFVDDINQPFFGGIRGFALDQAAAERARDAVAAAAFEGDDFAAGGEQNQAADDGGDGGQAARLEFESELPQAVGRDLRAGVKLDRDIQNGDDGGDDEREQKNEPPAGAARGILRAEKIHRQKEILGAACNASRSANSSKEMSLRKPKIEASSSGGKLAR